MNNNILLAVPLAVAPRLLALIARLALLPLKNKKSYNQNLLYQEMSTRSGSNLVLRIPINFHSYTCNNVY
jgi:hypothetical protein